MALDKPTGPTANGNDIIVQYTEFIWRKFIIATEL